MNGKIHILWLLTFLSCFSCSEKEGGNSLPLYQDPSENEILLIFLAGETEYRSAIDSRTPTAGEIFTDEGGIITGEHGKVLLKDHNGNLFYLFPQTHFTWSYNKEGTLSYLLHQGQMDFYSSQGIQVNTEEYLLSASSGLTGLTIDHQESSTYCYSSTVEIIMGDIAPEEMALFKREPNSQLAGYFQLLPVKMEKGKVYHWLHSNFRDSARHLSSALYEIESGRKNSEDILSSLRQAAERPDPEERTISEDSQLEEIILYLSENLDPENTTFHRIKIDPSDAQIDFGPFQGRETMEFPVIIGKDYTIESHIRGYEDLKDHFTAQREMNVSSIHMQRKASQTYEIKVNPASARIYINDLFAGKGQLVLTQKPGEEILIRCELEGYNRQEIYLEDLGIYPESLNIELKKTLLGQYFVSYEDPIGIDFYKDMYIVSDRKGNITSVLKDRGIRPWGYATSNSPNDWSSPVVAFDKIYFSGKRTLSVFDPLSKEVTNVYPLNSRSTHQYGRRVISFGNTIALATDDSIILLLPDLSKTLRVIDIPGGILMTPLSYKDYLYCVSIDGRIFKIDRNGNIIDSAFSNAFSPIAMTIAVSGNLGFFSDRHGLVVCFNLESLEVLWETQIPDKGRVVFRDIIIDHSLLYLYSEGHLYQLDAEKGDYIQALEYLFETPPLVQDQLLYGAVSSSRFIIKDLESKRILEEMPLPSPPSSAVFSNRETALIGMENGRIMIINQPMNP